MKLIGLLSWYNEPSEWLSATITSLTRIGVDELVAVDGVYAMYPNEVPRSPIRETEAIITACDAANIGLTLVRPRMRWWDGEREKRTALFRHAAAVAEPFVDWLIPIDADEVVTEGSPSVKKELAAIDADVAHAYLYQWAPEAKDDLQRRREQVTEFPSIYGAMQSRFFRAMVNMRVEKTHYTYVGDDADGKSWNLRACLAGRRLGYENANIVQLETRVAIEHRDLMRTAGRAAAKRQYYDARDASGVEKVAPLPEELAEAERIAHMLDIG